MAVGGANLNADHFRTQVSTFPLAFAFFSIVAHFTQPAVQGESMETIGGGLLASGLPVRVHDEPLRWAQHLHALVAAAEEHVVIPFGIAQELIERRAVDVPGCEDQTAIKCYPRLFQTQLFLGHHLAMHTLALDRRADEVTVWPERPTMVDALVNLRITAIGGADAHAAVWANIERDVNFALFSPGGDHRIRAHVAHDEIAGVRDFRFVAKQDPDLAEDLFHFQLVDFPVAKDPHLYFTCRWVDKIRDLGSVGQYGARCC